MPTLETARMVLRPFKSSDIDMLTALLSDPAVYEAYGRCEASKEWAEMVLAGMVSGKSTYPSPAYRIAVAIESKQSGELSGLVDVTCVNDLGELTVAMSAGARGQGIGPEVLPVLFGWLRTKTEVRLITASTLISNKAAQRLMAKIGMKEIDRDSAMVCGKIEVQTIEYELRI